VLYNAKALAFAIKIGGVVFPVDRRDVVFDDETGRGLCMSGANNGEDHLAHLMRDVFMKNLVTVIYVGVGDLRFISK